MIPFEKVRDLISKHSLLEKNLSSEEIDKKKYAEMSKEYSNLNEIIDEVKKIDLRRKIEFLEDKVSVNLDENLYSELLSLRNQLKGV